MWCLSFVNHFVNCVIAVNSRKKTSKTMWKIVVCITQTVMLWSKHLLKKVRVKNCSKTYMINTCESYVCTMYHNGFKIFFVVVFHFLNLSYWTRHFFLMNFFDEFFVTNFLWWNSSMNFFEKFFGMKFLWWNFLWQIFW